MSNKYFIFKNNEQQGPFTKEELKNLYLSATTLVWYEGLREWIQAKEIEELQEVIISQPPPVGSPPPPPQTKSEEVKHKRKGLAPLQWLGVVLLVLFVSFALYSRFSHVPSNDSSYRSHVKTIAEIEKESPEKFLDATGTYNENFWGDKMKIQGKVINKATVANYKDVVIEVIFYTKTDTELDRKRYVVYDNFPAHSTKEFNLRIEIPRACEKLGWKAVDAVSL